MVTDYSEICRSIEQQSFVLTDTLAQTIFSLLDLTSLNSTDNEQSIDSLCEKAFHHQQSVAAVCVYPAFVKQAAHRLCHTAVKVATVANFPEGTDSLTEVLRTIDLAIGDGAHEIDVVFPYRAYLAADRRSPADFLSECRRMAGSRTLKVILETGAQPDLSTVACMGRVALDAGADFLKTSTGKIPQGATLEAAACLLDLIKKESHSVGLKISGGVRTPEQASRYLMLAEHWMGKAWVKPDHFRIGASQLVDSLFLNSI